MKTIIGQFTSEAQAEDALRELNNIHLGQVEIGVRGKDGAIHTRRIDSGLSWDQGAQIGMMLGAFLGAFVGLLAGVGVFGGVAGHPTARIIWGGLLVGVSMGLLAGFVIGALILLFQPEPAATRFVAGGYPQEFVLAIQTQDAWVADTRALLLSRHATKVETDDGIVPIHRAKVA
jgi:hypothetical protein